MSFNELEETWQRFASTFRQPSSPSDQRDALKVLSDEALVLLDDMHRE